MTIVWFYTQLEEVELVIWQNRGRKRRGGGNLRQATIGTTTTKQNNKKQKQKQKQTKNEENPLNTEEIRFVVSLYWKLKKNSSFVWLMQICTYNQ